MEKNRGNKISKINFEKVQIRSSNKDVNNDLDISGFTNHKIQKPEKDIGPMLKNRFKKLDDSSNKKNSSTF